MASCFRLRGRPPNWDTSAFLLSRGTITCRHFLGPWAVSMVTLYFFAIFETVDRCLPASVLPQRCFCYPVQFVEPVNVVSQEIVLNNSPVLRLILGSPYRSGFQELVTKAHAMRNEFDL